MSIINKENILKVLIGYNPWWKTGTVIPALTKHYKRFAFYETMARLAETEMRRILVLSGMRRVGKTTAARARNFSTANSLYLDGSPNAETQRLSRNPRLLS